MSAPAVATGPELGARRRKRKPAPPPFDRRTYSREWQRRKREGERQPLIAGGLAVYRGQRDLQPLTVVSLRDGIARVTRDGRTWDEATAYLRGVQP